MIGKKIAIALSFQVMILTAHSQSLKNTSFRNQSGEKVLRIEMTIPLSLTDSWKLFTNDEKLKKWIAPLVHIDLKSGGYIVTNYDSTKSLSDSSSIRLPIITFIDRELLIFKVNLNNNFVEKLRDEDGDLLEIIQFKKIDNNNTKVISSMQGWGTGNDWDKAYDFFIRGNEWTYKELLKHYK
jgi:hypothetical protein